MGEITMDEQTIFISHRHEESELADTVSHHLQLWGIDKDQIFQSSDAEAGAPVWGDVKQGIISALARTNLLILIYTHNLPGWSYCMWECGLALNPGTEDTNIIVFQCTEDVPELFQEKVRIQAKLDGILQFTTQFHKAENFFPKQPARYPKVSDKIIRERAENFYADFVKAIPGRQYKEETPLLHLITLSLSSQCIDKLEEWKTAEDANDFIRDNLLIKGASPHCPPHFGYRGFGDGMKWSEIVKRWESNIGSTNGEDSWADALHSEIWRAVNNIPAQPAGLGLTSIEDPERHYVPLLCLMRNYPNGSAEFDVYLYLKNVDLYRKTEKNASP